MKNNFLLIGFDRSGTSAISRTLAAHPETELIFRPFNSGPIRQKMYQILDEENVSPRDREFFGELEKGKLDSSYFVSEWHKKFSTVQDSFVEDKIHVIITNLNHFAVRWVESNFPGIEQWAIWRDPKEILNSCIKNEFYGDWYADALSQVFKAVEQDPELKTLFATWIPEVEQGNVVIRTAFLIAVRNYFLFRHIKKGKVVDYDIFKKEPNRALKPLCEYFNLSTDFDFDPFIKIDLNSISSVDGYEANKKSTMVISVEDMEIASRMFRPLIEVYQQKHSQ